MRIPIPPLIPFSSLEKDDYYHFLREIGLSTEWPLMLDLAGASEEEVKAAIDGTDFIAIQFVEIYCVLHFH